MIKVGTIDEMTLIELVDYLELDGEGANVHEVAMELADGRQFCAIIGVDEGAGYIEGGLTRIAEARGDYG